MKLEAYELLKKHRLFIYGHTPFWVVASQEPNTNKKPNTVMVDNEDLDTAIFECVKKMGNKNEQ